jgi:hypothetical protein
MGLNHNYHYYFQQLAHQNPLSFNYHPAVEGVKHKKTIWYSLWTEFLPNPGGIIIQLRINLSIMISIKPKKTSIVIHVRISYQSSRQYFNGASLKAHLFDKSMRKNRFILAMIPLLHIFSSFRKKIYPKNSCFPLISIFFKFCLKSGSWLFRLSLKGWWGPLKGNSLKYRHEFL